MEHCIKRGRTHLFAPSINVVVLATIDGQVNQQDLDRAVKQAVQHNEILCSTIEYQENGLAYYHEKKAPKIVIQTYDHDWKDVVAEQEHTVFHLTKGELIRFFTKQTAANMELLIIAHHLAGDGLSITYLVNDILQALNGHELQTKELQPMEDTDIPKDAKLNLMMRWMLKRWNKTWKKNEKIFSFSDYETMFQKFWKTRKTNIFCEQITAKELDVLRAKAKQHDVTINSIFTTAIIQAKREPAEIGLSVNLREKDNCRMGNFVTGITISYQYDNSVDFWKNAKEVHHRIYHKLDNVKEKYFLAQFMNSIEPTLIDAAYFSAFDDYESKMAGTMADMFGYTKQPKGINLSNLTTLDDKIMSGKYQLSGFLIVPPIVPNATCMLGISTYRENVSITFHCFDHEDTNAARIFFQRIISIIQVICKD